MTRWLPLWRTATNPFCSRIRQISEPERTRSLPNRNLNLSHEDFVAKTPGDFRRVGHFEEQRKRLDEVRTRFFNWRAVAPGRVPPKPCKDPICSREETRQVRRAYGNTQSRA